MENVSPYLFYLIWSAAILYTLIVIVLLVLSSIKLKKNYKSASTDIF